MSRSEASEDLRDPKAHQDSSRGASRWTHAGSGPEDRQGKTGTRSECLARPSRVCGKKTCSHRDALEFVSHILLTKTGEKDELVRATHTAAADTQNALVPTCQTCTHVSLARHPRLQGRQQHPHLADEKTEVQRGCKTHVRSQGQPRGRVQAHALFRGQSTSWCFRRASRTSCLLSSVAA